MGFTFVDLFAGIGGFHAALSALGGRCVYASEIDQDAARIYARNWGLTPAGDITLAANDEVMDVPEHDVLVGGFPCQPFSKSGKQRGMDEARGTLFWNIAKIIEVRKPKLVLLENVRNIAGPRHEHEWAVIIKTLRELGYRVAGTPFVLSPHSIRPEFGGRPQVRDRVFICATRIPAGNQRAIGEPRLPDLSGVQQGWDPQEWQLASHLPLDKKLTKDVRAYVELSADERFWIDGWDDFVVTMRKVLKDAPLPGFPIWADDWVDSNALRIPKGTPDWKANFLRKNADFYTAHKETLDAWLKRWDGLKDFPPSRRKLEWQAQDAARLWDTVIHLRPSGIRAKKPTYLPALVAITQTSIVGKAKRRITVREAARLQGLPDWFDFLDQRVSTSYKQLGNAVNVGAVYNVLRAQVLRDIDLLAGTPEMIRAILSAPPSPDLLLARHSTLHSPRPPQQGDLFNESTELRLVN